MCLIMIYGFTRNHAKISVFKKNSLIKKERIKVGQAGIVAVKLVKKPI